MNGSRTTVAVFVTAICALVAVICGLLAHFAPWTWGAAGVTALLVPVVILRLTAPRAALIPPDRQLCPDLPIPPQEKWERRLVDVRLASAWDDYAFLFSATVQWRPFDAAPDDRSVNPGGIAVGEVLARAQLITAATEPGDYALAQHQLDAALARMEPDAAGSVDAMATDVVLRLVDADRQRLESLADVRKKEAVWEHRRKYELNQRAYLGGDVLKDTGSAVVWWLARNEDRIEKVVDDIGLLAHLTAAANNEDVPERFRHPAGQSDTPDTSARWDPAAPPGSHNGFSLPGWAADGFRGAARDEIGAVEDLFASSGFEPGHPSRPLIARQIAQALATSGNAAAAARIREYYDPDPEPKSEPGADPAGGTQAESGTTYEEAP
ncbi:hypothetical protein BIV57_19995 [Mangrovactinospora gilvigrisea]|uniref:Uncharacterized protein n=1 Tax=Mangrovactinospora gilvigrisea TaxID=1428644 RepID=A0A1J7BAX0_9ACTN|nr:hypothetical protein [Mangrovactinospora gilvigrisea]OIV35757.1 hypothetical protein BIV57_19995 [Mangrovactinospora gilvigrisea]